MAMFGKDAQAQSQSTKFAQTQLYPFQNIPISNQRATR
jgi:hypothetical protein